MGKFKITCPTPNCNTTISLNSDDWGTDEFERITCPACKKIIKKYDNPNYKRNNNQKTPPKSSAKDSNKTAVVATNKKAEFAITDLKKDQTPAWLIDMNSDSVYELKFGKQTIGRAGSSKPSDIALITKDVSISGAHFRIEINRTANQGIEFVISDNSSANGVMLNQKRKLEAGEEVVLKDGDVIRLGRSDLYFVSAMSGIKNKNEALTYFKQKHSR
jgi:pSer/pThr/pTyr-binding forkhead associated (FHA) protein